MGLDGQLESGHLAVLDDVDTHFVALARKGPGHMVVLEVLVATCVLAAKDITRRLGGRAAVR